MRNLCRGLCSAAAWRGALLRHSHLAEEGGARHLSAAGRLALGVDGAADGGGSRGCSSRVSPSSRPAPPLPQGPGLSAGRRGRRMCERLSGDHQAAPHGQVGRLSAGALARQSPLHREPLAAVPRGGEGGAQKRVSSRLRVAGAASGLTRCCRGGKAVL